ncbi:MAG: ribose-phosphate pyrophosphokinase [Clostridia bacterium]|jgi:ribose-phosphate pyrophosphokinase|nr:ribose-phosphate pyrophosphokinase [Clostridia bacterium]
MISHGTKIKLFAGNSNPVLAQKIADRLGMPLGNCVVKQFSDGETSVSINETVRGCDVFVIQSTCYPVNDNFMELLIMIDAFRRASAGRITAVMPYFGYARQDRKAKPRDPISAKLCAEMLEAAGANRVLTMDLHASQIQGFFNIPLDNLVGTKLLSQYFYDRIGAGNPDYVVVSPDLGSVTRARKFTDKLDLPMAIVDKRRPKPNVSEVMNIIGDVKGKKVILVDDMVDTAGTLCHGAKALVERGGATEIIACATHGVLSGPAIERLQDSVISKLILLDTIPVEGEKAIDKIEVLSVADLFSEAIRRVFGETAMSDLYN